jgi:hypothetical protein
LGVERVKLSIWDDRGRIELDFIRFAPRISKKINKRLTITFPGRLVESRHDMGGDFESILPESVHGLLILDIGIVSFVGCEDSIVGRLNTDFESGHSSLSPLFT